MPCTPPCPHCGPLYAAALEAVSHLTTDGAPPAETPSTEPCTYPDCGCKVQEANGLPDCEGAARALGVSGNDEGRAKADAKRQDATARGLPSGVDLPDGAKR